MDSGSSESCVTVPILETVKLSENVEPATTESPTVAETTSTISSMLSEFSEHPEKLTSMLENAGTGIGNMLNNFDMSTITSALGDLTGEGGLGGMLSGIQNNMDPELKAKAERLARGGQGKQLQQLLQKNGVNMKQIRSQALANQRAQRGLGSTNPTQSALLITKSRQLKTRQVPKGDGASSTADLAACAKTILNCTDPVEISCSRLAVGPWVGKKIKIWYNDAYLGKNRRTSKIVGYPIGSEILIIGDDALTEADFLEVEKLL